MREFELIRQSDAAAEKCQYGSSISSTSCRPASPQFAEQPRALVEAALESGGRPVDLVYEVPQDINEACKRLLDLLDEADDYCLAGEHLVTLASPPAVRAYREWFLREFIEQSDRSTADTVVRHGNPSSSSSAATYEDETLGEQDAHETEADGGRRPSMATRRR